MSSLDPTVVLANELANSELLASAGPSTETIPSGLPFTRQEWSLDEVAQHQAAGSSARAEVVPTESTVPPAVPPVLLDKRTVSGRYRSSGGSYQLELRLDVDGRRPTMRISGDFFRTSGATVVYFGSFNVDSVSVSTTDSTATLEGMGAYTWSTAAAKVQVIIPRTTISQSAAAATLQFFTKTGAPGASYACDFESGYFRTVQYEQDHVSGVTPFDSYDTGSLPSGGPARVLSVVKAFAEAGVELQTTGGWSEVSMTSIGSAWSDAELHASMETQFSQWQDEPQWKVYLLAANLHDIGTGLRGIMFDQHGRQRQGCAVFHDVIGGSSPDSLRAQLRTYVHELGHCFNLLHSWQKSLANPPAPNRPDALSWMNYIQFYPGGAPAYWANFPFQFDDIELVHLRHGARNDVIMGGNAFAAGAALLEPQALAEVVDDRSGLQLRLESRKTYAFGEPVVLEIKLATTDLRAKQVHSHLHPKGGFVQVAICKPNGQVVNYEPVVEYCIDESMVTTLDQERPALYESAYIGFGHEGFYFEQPGAYEIRAVYYALDGSLVISNPIGLRVRSPLSVADEEVAELFLGDEQGMLLSMLGSDSEHLSSGNGAFDLLLDKYNDHPLAVYAKLLKGINAGREFKTITPDKILAVRQPKAEASVKCLSGVVNAAGTGRLDNITLNLAMRKLVRAYKLVGDEEKVQSVKQKMLNFFRHKALKSQVLRQIEAQVSAL
ncbi:hypothetical protein [Leptolyngbya sp. FACHB-261]|uniref:hypothetical protein n=1 Tax=Leptolyngbya sp. FACHB-261 TaxID=2692806 RepID=UPI001688725E|nr:hypothetical protein [Leptolyngbya sp. FACHB-261]MBD2100551.1 hypothetical protein [Leptolyngbya sp. FACHB-261]